MKPQMKTLKMNDGEVRMLVRAVSHSVKGSCVIVDAPRPAKTLLKKCLALAASIVRGGA